MFTNEELLIMMNLTRIGLNGMRAERAKFHYLSDDILAQYDENINLTEKLLEKLAGLVGVPL